MTKHNKQKIVQAALCLLISFYLGSSLLAQENNGNVGIGTTTPQAKLHVAGDLQVEDLSGNGERTLVATPEGKLKAVTNSEPNPSNADTLRAQFIELIDEEGDTKFILNAHTGEFQMMDNDTIWYEMEVNSPPNENTLLNNNEGIFTFNNVSFGEGESIANDIIFKISDSLTEIEIDGEIEIEGIDPPSKCLVKAKKILIDALNNKQLKQIIVERRLDADLLQHDTFTITASSEEGVNKVKVEVLDAGIINLKVTGKCPCTMFKETISLPEEGKTLVIDSQSPSLKNITVFEESEDGKFTPTNSFQIDLDTGKKIQLTFTDEENERTRVQNAVKDIFNSLEKQTVFGVNDISQTDKATGITTSASIQDIIQTPANLSDLEGDFNEVTTSITNLQIVQVNNTDNINNLGLNLEELQSNQEENTQEIVQITNDVQDLINQLNSGGGGGTGTPEEVIVSKDGSTGTLESEAVELTAADGNTAEFKKDGIVFKGPDGTTFFIDCNAISKFKPDKSAAFVGMDFNLNDEAFDVFADLNVFGSITETGKKITKIDHPSDPTNQYLQHSYIGTNELLNEYSGNTTTDANGKATVQLPSYVQAFNTDFRYQLTVIGSFAQAIIAEKIRNNQFVIHTNQPNVEVSWEVKGVRNDTYAQENPLEVEIPKANTEKGTLLYNSSNKAFTPVLKRKSNLQESVVAGD